jgi:hypothetical protein
LVHTIVAIAVATIPANAIMVIYIDSIDNNTLDWNQFLPEFVEFYPISFLVCLVSMLLTHSILHSENKSDLKSYLVAGAWFGLFSPVAVFIILAIRYG